jgi:hypothetical protein
MMWDISRLRMMKRETKRIGFCPISWKGIISVRRLNL